MPILLRIKPPYIGTVLRWARQIFIEIVWMQLEQHDLPSYIQPPNDPHKLIYGLLHQLTGLHHPDVLND